MPEEIELEEPSSTITLSARDPKSLTLKIIAPLARLIRDNHLWPLSYFLIILSGIFIHILITSLGYIESHLIAPAYFMYQKIHVNVWLLASIIGSSLWWTAFTPILFQRLRFGIVHLESSYFNHTDATQYDDNQLLHTYRPSYDRTKALKVITGFLLFYVPLPSCFGLLWLIGYPGIHKEQVLQSLITASLGSSSFHASYYFSLCLYSQHRQRSIRQADDIDYTEDLSGEASSVNMIALNGV